MSSRIIWKNGKFLPESEAALSLYSSSINFGDGIFEMMRTFDRLPFRMAEHVVRLFNSAKYVGIDIPYSPDEIVQSHYDLIYENRDIDDELRTLIHVDRGILPIYEDMGLEMGVQVYITAFPLKWIVKGASKYYEEGVHAIVTQQRTAKYIEAKVKNRSRLHYRLAELEAKRIDQQGWAVLLDDYGDIAEGSGSNIFMVKGGRLFTPTTASCLKGISRDYILELARQHNIVCEERSLDVYDGVTADEIFFTNTPFSVLPVTKFNHSTVGNGKIGEVTKFLTEQWIKEVNCDFIEQAKRWDSAV